MSLGEVLSGKAGLSGVQWALSGQTCRQRVRRAVHDLLADEWSPGNLHLTRAKYKPGRKLDAYFDVPVRSRWTGKITTRPIAVRWRAEGLTGTEASDLTDAQGEVERRGLAGPYTQLWSDDAESRMQVMVFPLDPTFHQLARLSDPAYVQAQLSALDRSTNRYRVTPVRYRPGERHVLRYEAEGGENARVLYTKLYQTQEGADRANRIARRITEWLETRGGRLKGARPFAVLEADAAILYPKISGKPLSRMLQRPGKNLTEALRAAGEGLRYLHDGPPSLSADLVENPYGNEMRLIARASEHLQVLLPEGYTRVEAILRRAAEQLAGMPQEAATFTHSDFKADHLLVRPGGLTLIDFDTCALADPALDVGKFLADLDYWFTRYRLSGAGQAQTEFLQGYSRGVPPERLQRSRVFHALVLVKITVRRVRLFDRNWTAQTTHLLQRAEDILNENALVHTRTAGRLPTV
jgi:aminoglycoside phosphotransferase (APT) family kinase protein